MKTLEELNSPVLAFIRDKCETGAGKEIECKLLFERWKDWCDSIGRKETGTVQTFGRDLGASCPKVTSYATHRHGARMRLFRGIDVKPGA